MDESDVTPAYGATPAYFYPVRIPGGVLPYKRLMGMCRWMGSHFHDWIDYNGVQFFKQGPAYKKEGPDPNNGSNQQ